MISIYVDRNEGQKSDEHWIPVFTGIELILSAGDKPEGLYLNMIPGLFGILIFEFV
jgi:hypothetical protein